MRDATGSMQSLAVFGATSEIGQAIAKAFCRRRTRRVTLLARDPSKVDDFAAELKELGADSVDSWAFDARDSHSHSEVMDRLFSQGNDVDCVLIAFGVLGDSAVIDHAPEEIIELFETNTIGAASVALHAAQRMRAQGHGQIILLSSVASERARKVNYAYGASKAAADMFAQGLGDLLVGTGVKILVVRPGYVFTKMTKHHKPAPFATDPVTVAAGVMRAMERGLEIVWVPSILRYVMSAVRHLPRAVFRKLPF